MTESYVPEPAWEFAAAVIDPSLLAHATHVARDLMRVTGEGSLAADAARLQASAGGSIEEREAADLLFLDRLTRRLRSSAPRLTPLLPELSRRGRVALLNPTRLALRAAVDVGAVTSPAVIARVAASDARLLRASLGQSTDGMRGRLDLVAARRFGIDRLDDLRPRLVPDRPLTTDAATIAKLHYLVDEMEFVWILWEKTGNWRVPTVPHLPISHRDARAITGWSAVALDTRLARGRKWDRALDAARLRGGTSSQHETVTFDARRFMAWWIALSN